ncbi:MAG TPA: hypothetical protein VF521_01790 [Pyrinomonadaceae bacterium]
MLRRMTAALLAALLLQTFAPAAARAETQAEKDAKRAARVKRAVEKVGTGPSARVLVRMKDKTALDGYVESAGADTFVVVGRKASLLKSVKGKIVGQKDGAPITVSYDQVERVRGLNLSTGQKVAIGFAAAGAFLGALTLFALIVGPHLPD